MRLLSVRHLGAVVTLTFALSVSAASPVPAGAGGTGKPSIATAVPGDAGTESLPAGGTACPSTKSKTSVSFAACGGTATKVSSRETASLPTGTAACASTAAKQSSAAGMCSGTGTTAAGSATAPFTVALSASSVSVTPGASTTLTATSNQDVGPTPYYIEIFNSSTGSIEAWCGFGVTCATVVAQSGSTVQNYVAYISAFGTASPPPSIQATSSTLVVSWLTVALEATGQFLAPGQAVTLTATASLDVGPTPFWIEIVDVEGATSPIICGFGTTCSASVTHSGAFSNFAAYVSRFGTTDPPPDVRSQACCIDVTWMSVGLTASPQALTAGETTTLTATANMDVGPTPFSILIYGESSSAPVAVCGYGTTCEVAVTQPAPVITVYVAVIAPVAHTIPTYPPPGVRATSDPVAVSWNPPPAPVAVPYVIGDTSTADAASTLQAAGLVLGTVGDDIDCDSIGMVEREDPPAGTQVVPGYAVSIYFGVPPAPPQECQ